MELVLPFNTRSLSRTYLFDAYTSGITTTKFDFLRTQVPYNVGLFCPKSLVDENAASDFILFAFFPWMNFEAHERTGLLVRDTSVALPAAFDDAQLFDLLRDNTRREHYSFLILNEARLKGAAGYCDDREIVSMHEFLVIGVNEQTHDLIGVSYDAQGQFEAKPYKLCDVASALRIPEALHQMLPPWKKPTLIAWKAGAAPKPEITPACYAQLLDAFLNGRPSSQTVIDFAIFPNLGEGVYGIRVHELLSSYFAKVAGGSVRMDPRITRLLLEHKRIQMRVASSFPCLGRDFASKIEEQWKLAADMQQCAVEFAISGKQHLLGILCEKHTRFALTEESTLSPMLARLQNG